MALSFLKISQKYSLGHRCILKHSVLWNMMFLWKFFGIKIISRAVISWIEMRAWHDEKIKFYRLDCKKISVTESETVRQPISRQVFCSSNSETDLSLFKFLNVYTLYDYNLQMLSVVSNCPLYIYILSL